MASIGSNSKPAYVYDQASDTWIPLGVPSHSHENYASLPPQSGNSGKVLQTNGSTLSWVTQATTDDLELLSIIGAY